MVRHDWILRLGQADEDKCRLFGAFRETVPHLLPGCKKLAGSEYVKIHDKALKVLAVYWAIDNELLPENNEMVHTDMGERKSD